METPELGHISGYHNMHRLLNISRLLDSNHPTYSVRVLNTLDLIPFHFSSHLICFIPRTRIHKHHGDVEYPIESSGIEPTSSV